MNNIIKDLLLKYYKRVKKDNGTPIVRIQIGEKEFDSSDELKEYAYQVKELEELGFVKAERKEGRELIIKKVSLNLDRIREAENYLKEIDKTFIPLSESISKVDKLIEKYGQSAQAAALYLEDIKNNKFVHIETLDRDEFILKCIIGLEQNEENVYLREFSQNLYSDSHMLDDGKIISLALKYIKKYHKETHSYHYKENGWEYLSDKDLLQRFHVYKTDDLIRLKGNIEIETEKFYLNISDLNQGIALPQSSLKDIISVKILGNNEFLTVENLTSYERISDNAVFYLGGFASKEQIKFLKEIKKNNKATKYFHFGDLDVGGLRIFKNVRDETGTNFHLKYMDEKYLLTDYAKPISEKERLSLENLMKYPETKDLAEKILSAGKKVEQEIISLALSEERQ